MTIEQHIEELRAELRNGVDPDERRWIMTELERAQAKLEEVWATWATEEGLVDAEPPF